MAITYEQSSPMADKMLEPDGSIQTRSGTQVAPPSSAGAQMYQISSPIADKMLNPDGSISTGLGGGGGGGATLPKTTNVLMGDGAGGAKDAGFSSDGSGNLTVNGQVYSNGGQLVVGCAGLTALVRGGSWLLYMGYFNPPGGSDAVNNILCAAPLFVNRDPLNPNEVASKHYVDTNFAPIAAARSEAQDARIAALEERIARLEARKG